MIRSRTFKPLMKLLRALPLAAAASAICYLALKPWPSAEYIPEMPKALGQFLDGEDFGCNVVAFAALAAIVHFTFSGFRREPPSVLWRRGWIIGTLVVALECGQIFLPRRSFDVKDIAAGWLGIVVASLPWSRMRPLAASQPDATREEPMR